MRRMLIASAIIGFVIVFSTSTLTQHICPTKHANAEVPSYAKWGNLAMKKTKERYQHSSIIDYKHLGRTEDTKTSTEKFKLWLKNQNKEFGVIVSITFNKDTEKVIDITFREVPR
jgi:hypothetical protein